MKIKLPKIRRSWIHNSFPTLNYEFKNIDYKNEIMTTKIYNSMHETDFDKLYNTFLHGFYIK